MNKKEIQTVIDILNAFGRKLTLRQLNETDYVINDAQTANNYVLYNTTNSTLVLDFVKDNLVKVSKINF